VRHFALSVVLVTSCFASLASADDGLPLPASPVAAAPAPRVVVVGVDQKTLDALGPWGGSYRALHPKLIDALDKANVRGIAFDVYFPENPDFAAATAAIAKTAAASKAPVVIAAKPEEAENAAVLRDAKVPEGSVTVATALDVTSDADGTTVRAKDMALPALEDGRRPLSVELALRTGVLSQGDLAKVVEPLTTGVENGKPVTIQGILPRSGDPGSVTTVSYVDVLQGKVDPAVLAGALVVVGMTDGKTDMHTNPVTGADISGVYFHAFALQRFLDLTKPDPGKPAPKTAPGAPPASAGIIRPLELSTGAATR
jgi:adenylate cyclase